MTKNPKPERHKLTILSSKKPIFRFFQNRSLFVKQKISCSEQQNEIRSVWKKQNEKRSVLEKDVSSTTLVQYDRRCIAYFLQEPITFDCQ